MVSPAIFGLLLNFLFFLLIIGQLVRDLLVGSLDASSKDLRSFTFTSDQNSLANGNN
jgi:hypothetical protein